jgi:hypothetical protein
VIERRDDAPRPTLLSKRPYLSPVYLDTVDARTTAREKSAWLLEELP